jgi:DNA-binding transcriptional MerR regulator
MATYQIGQVSERLGLSNDTLRYYEKIGLLPRVSRNLSGLRAYNDKDISSLYFIQRAQKMNFTLAEISELMRMREAPQTARPKVRGLTRRKLNEIETYLADLKALRDELRLLLNVCARSKDTCPIIEDFGKEGSFSKHQGNRQLRPKKRQ